MLHHGRIESIVWKSKCLPRDGGHSFVLHLGLGSIENLKEFRDTSTLSCMKVCLQTLDMIMKIISELLHQTAG